MVQQKLLENQCQYTWLFQSRAVPNILRLCSRYSHGSAGSVRRWAPMAPDEPCSLIMGSVRFVYDVHCFDGKNTAVDGTTESSVNRA